MLARLAIPFASCPSAPMKITLPASVLLIGSLVATSPVLADCPGPFLKDVKSAYQQAQAAEKQGNQSAALRLYAQSEGGVCEGANPYEADAARRASSLGLTLGGAAEKKGDWQQAFELYEAGGHFALADRAFMSVTRAKADDPHAYEAARRHFNGRSIESFASNNAAALKVTGAYRPDAKLIAEVSAMPAKGFERASQREMAAFNEQFLRDYVQLIQTRTDDATDATAIQRMISAQQAFAQKWQQSTDPMKSSREALQAMRMWGSNSGDSQLEKHAEALFAQRADQHAQLLAQKYSGAPKLLEDAMDFVTMQGLDAAKSDARLAGLRSQASRLADDAMAKGRYQLASEYYDVVGDSAKSQAASEKQSQAAMAKMQPSIDAARKQAEALQRQFGDPATVKAMREQAEAARRSIQQQ